MVSQACARGLEAQCLPASCHRTCSNFATFSRTCWPGWREWPSPKGCRVL